MHDDCGGLLGPIEGFEDFKEHAAMEEQVLEPLQDTNPIPMWHSGNFWMPPTINAATQALADLKKLLYPPRTFKGHEYRASGLSSLLQKCLTWMEGFL